MSNYKKININNYTSKQGEEYLDAFRDGRSRDLDPVKVSYALLTLVKNFNELVDDYEKMKELVVKMRDRKKPGPKPKSNKSQGGEIDKGKTLV